MPSDYYLAWWNLENLFDEENSPRRTDKVARVFKNDIAGWTLGLLNRKITQHATPSRPRGIARSAPRAAVAWAPGGRRVARAAAPSDPRLGRSLTLTWRLNDVRHTAGPGWEVRTVGGPKPADEIVRLPRRSCCPTLSDL